MKKLLVLIPFLLLFQVSYADVVPVNSHHVRKCVKITNTSDFPDFYIVACIKSVTRTEIEVSVIDSDKCLEAGYKFNSLYIVAAKKRYLEDQLKGSVDWFNDENIRQQNLKISTSDFSITNDSAVSSIDEFYKIIEITDKKILLYKYKELIRYNDGSPIQLKKFPYVKVKKESDAIEGIYPQAEMFNFLTALLITIFIESIILFLLFKTKYRKLNIKNKLLLITGLVTSFSTLPYVWFVFPALIQSRFPYILISECFAISIESVLIYYLLKIDYKKAFLVSVICNLISFSIGLFINCILYSPDSVGHLIQSIFR